MLSRRLLATLLLASLVLAGCAQQEGDGGDGGAGGDDAQTRFIVGTDAAFPPFEEIAANGSFEGYDIDVMDEIARRNNWTIEYRNLAFDTLIQSLQNEQIDMAISAMSINANRSQVVDFSIPYYEANQSIMQLIADVNTYTALEDMKGKDLRFGVQSGTVAADIVEAEFTSQGDGELKRYDTYPLALQALKTKEVDVVMMDAPAQREAAKTDPLVKVAFEFSTGDIYGIAITKGDTATLTKVNDALEAMQDDGTLAQLRQKWAI